MNVPALVKTLFERVDTIPLSVTLREGDIAFPVLLTLHVLGMCLFAGLIIMMDLRLLGVGNMRTPFSQVQRRLFLGQMLGMAIMAGTGGVLVFAQPMRYYGNVFFWVKMLMMVLAGLNAMVFHFSTYNSVAKWDESSGTPFGAKLSAVVSLGLWGSVVIIGRLIAYNWFNK